MTKIVRTKLLGDNGITRGRVPAELINALKGQPGDHLEFHLEDGNRRVLITIEHASRSSQKRKPRAVRR